MGISDFFNLFLIIGAVQGFVFIFATFSLRKKIEKPILFLNLFVLFLSLNNLQSWYIDRQDLDADVLDRFITIPWYILIVPMFYSFLIYYLQIERKKTPLIVVSITLFTIALITRFLLINAVDNNRIEISILKKYHLVEDVFAFSYSVILYCMSISVLRKHKSLYSKILVFDNLKWIHLFFKLGGVVFGFWVLAILLNNFSDQINAPYTYYPLRFFSSILIYWVAYQAFFQYRLLKDRIKLRQLIQKDKFKSDDLSIEFTPKTKLTYQEFALYVKENNSFLNPHLSLESLAAELSIGVSTLSKVVNSKEENFSDFINSHRIEAAKKFLTIADFDNYTIVAIGLECGFNSKSTFYNAFKKSTGKTPSEFRKLNKT
ncbi:helix-turn-helix domain-containing protein [uncultured Croceitalea sp.]|uniref:helix-turn-helix domain-containing protein n=1 Tax=uncultured Croceitalea sp. TaxID=1798908 RepID=UPI003305CD84